MASDLLVIVYDVNPHIWAADNVQNGSSNSHTLTLTNLTEQLLVFINAFLLLGKNHRLAVIAASHTATQFIYPLPSKLGLQLSAEQKDIQEESKQLDHELGIEESADIMSHLNVHTAIATQLRQFILHQSLAHRNRHSSSPTSTLLSGALSLAMCYVNKQRSLTTKLRSRLMCMVAPSDSSGQYISVMNAVFEAQKLNIPIDALILNQHLLGSHSTPTDNTTTDSRLMQQASHLTHGVYHSLTANDIDGLLQLLFMLFLPDSTARQQLILPTLETVDYRASCFCHRKTVDVAHVCPVCLAIWCDKGNKCDCCGTVFAAAPPPRRAAARPATAAVAVG